MYNYIILLSYDYQYKGTPNDVDITRSQTIFANHIIGWVLSTRDAPIVCLSVVYLCIHEVDSYCKIVYDHVVFSLWWWIYKCNGQRICILLLFIIMYIDQWNHAFVFISSFGSKFLVYCLMKYFNYFFCSTQSNKLVTVIY